MIKRPGIRRRFPSIKAYLKSYVLGLDGWESREKVQLFQYASGELTETRSEIEGQVFVFPFDAGSAAHRLHSVAAVYRWQAIQAALSMKQGLKEEWARSVAYDYWGWRLDVRFHMHALSQFERGERPQKLRMLFLHQMGGTIANCLTLGWRDWAIDLTRRVNWGLDHDEFNDGDDSAHRRTQHFVLRLIGRWRQWPERDGPRCAFDEPLFNALLEHWTTPDLGELSPLLLAACDRHTHQARVDSNKESFDVPYSSMYYDPFEILAVLKLRELHGLPNPVLDHVLMNTPLARIPISTLPYSDELLEGVLARARQQFPDL